MANIWFVTPTHRSSSQDEPHRFYRRPEGHTIRELIVENGNALGTHAPGKRVILHSKPTVGAARRKALEWLREHAPDDLVCWMDSDDTYHHSYVSRHLEAYATRANDSVVQCADGHYVQFRKGTMRPGVGRELFWVERSVGIMGATMFGKVSAFSLPDEETTCGEENAMVSASNVVKIDLPIAVCRFGPDHTWQIPPCRYVLLCGGATPAAFMADKPTGPLLNVRELVVQYPNAFIPMGTNKQEATE